jgi:hypothetical protein
MMIRGQLSLESKPYRAVRFLIAATMDIESLLVSSLGAIPASSSFARFGSGSFYGDLVKSPIV